MRATTLRSRAKLPATKRKSQTTRKSSVASRSGSGVKAKKSRSQLRRSMRMPAAKGSSRTRQSARTTTDHDEIRRWVEARGGHPATVKRTAKGKQQAGILRIDFPGFSGARSLASISWEEWFRMFDERGLAFLYQDKTSNGKPSRFSKLVNRK